MLLAIDAGNTNIVFALSDGKAILHSWRCRTDAARTADEYASWLYPLFIQRKLEVSAIKSIIISSVVPDATFNLLKLCRETFGLEPLLVNHETVGIKVKLARPQEAGADRLVNACAVIRDYGKPAIVIDFGTATTFDVVNEAGEFCGGAISPGINLSMKALEQAAAKLPRVDVRRPPAVIGTDTVSAMQSGVYWGYAGLIEGMINRITAELSAKKVHIIATGGLASLFADAIPAIEKVDMDLTLRGLIYIHSAHKNSKAV